MTKSVQEGRLYNVKSRYIPACVGEDLQVFFNVYGDLDIFPTTVLLALKRFSLSPSNLLTYVDDICGNRVDAESVLVSISITDEETFFEDGVTTSVEAEIKATGKVEGFLFLTPWLQKIWISHYEYSSLNRISG